jgi:hypothetical protein
VIYDTYIDRMRCPECGEETEVIIEDTQGENKMRTLHPHDVVAEFRSRQFVEIENDGDCAECGCSFDVHIPIIHGVIGRFATGGRFDCSMSPDDVIRYLSEACLNGYNIRQAMQRKTDVVEMILRFWTISHDGGDIPSEWHVSEEGLPIIGASTPADELIRSLAKYLNGG